MDDGSLQRLCFRFRVFVLEDFNEKIFRDIECAVVLTYFFSFFRWLYFLTIVLWMREGKQSLKLLCYYLLGLVGLRRFVDFQRS